MSGYHKKPEWGIALPDFLTPQDPNDLNDILVCLICLLAALAVTFSISH